MLRENFSASVFVRVLGVDSRNPMSRTHTLTHTHPHTNNSKAQTNNNIPTTPRTNSPPTSSPPHQTPQAWTVTAHPALLNSGSLQHPPHAW